MLASSLLPSFAMMLWGVRQSLHCTASIVLPTLYRAYCTAPDVLHILYCLHCTVSIVLPPLYCIYCTASTVLRILYCLRCTVSIILPTQYFCSPTIFSFLVCNGAVGGCSKTHTALPRMLHLHCNSYIVLPLLHYLFCDFTPACLPPCPQWSLGVCGATYTVLP